MVARPALVDPRAVVGITSLTRGAVADDRVREAAWVARCVGRSDAFLLSDSDLSALATYLTRLDAEWGEPLFTAGHRSRGVWIIRDGLVELFAGAGRRRQVVQLLRPGDVDGDIEVLLDVPFAYSARAATDTTALFLGAEAFEQLLVDHPGVARRWLTSVAARVANAQRRIVGLLGGTLTVQVARLLRDEAVDGEIPLPQRTLAAMLGVQRPSLNKILKDLEKRGLVRVGYGRIAVTDAQALSRLAA